MPYNFRDTNENWNSNLHLCNKSRIDFASMEDILSDKYPDVKFNLLIMRPNVVI